MIEDHLESVHSENRTLDLQGELKRWIEVLKNEYNPEKVILFGSFVNGKVRRWSDIDLVIIKETKKSFLDRIKEVILLLRPKVGMDVLVYTPKEFESLCETRTFFKNEICLKGRLIYERGGSKLD
jgi:predicted nucleotidyltransferase